MQKELRVSADKPYPLGVYRQDNYIRISMVSECESCGIILYDLDKKEVGRAELAGSFRTGKVCHGRIADIDSAKYYQLYENGRIVCDTHMREYDGKTFFGDAVNPEDIYSLISDSEFDWGEDVSPGLLYEESFIYCMHARGFTKHSSSGVKGKGTFKGIIEKIPYFKTLGITTLELMPIYELKEFEQDKTPLNSNGYEHIVSDTDSNKLNYWGYEEGLYYAVRNAYSMGGNASLEFKELVKALHVAGMEIILQFYFPSGVSYSEVSEILRYWKTEYHVDGFHLKGDNVPIMMICSEPLLSDSKIFHTYFNINPEAYTDKSSGPRNLAYYHDDYMYAMRRFLKGDEDMLSTVLRMMRRQPMEAAQINYFTNYYGFTLADMVSYERKHNELNGENNRDGIDYNHTWNCGAEGKSRKKNVVALRKKQMRNALCMLIFSQGTPLIYMGDEFGNSQDGNNNPYCQDNKTGWLDWRNKEQNKELFEYVKQLIALRKKHPILHKSTEMRLMDYISCGYPDLSYHSTQAWKPDMSNVSRHIGILYCGKYAKTDEGKDDIFFYVAMNMHWETHEFALPKLPKGEEWRLLTDTEEWDICEEGTPIDNQQYGMVNPRSIRIYISAKGSGTK